MVIKISDKNSSENWDFLKPQKKIGMVSFTDPREEVKLTKEREEYILKCHNEITQLITNFGFNTINPQVTMKGQKIADKKWGISTEEEIFQLNKTFIEETIAGIIIGCFAWNEPNIPLELVKKLNVPIALITKNNPRWPGITAITSTGASFWQLAPNFYSRYHERLIVNQEETGEELQTWLKAISTIDHLKNGKLLLWGGSPSLNMEHLNDDITSLKQFIVKDIITEDQYLIIKKAEEILELQTDRVESFLSWLIKMKCKIIYDNDKVSKKSIQKQIALYLASKDLLNKHHKSNERIVGVSIKCQPEISVAYGITPCLIPAFLPYPIDNEGEKPIIPTVCEGDIKGLITAVMLHGFNYHVPPLFGDLKIINEKYFVIANCGAASLFYAALSSNPEIALSKSTIQAQCQGVSGGAFGYSTPTHKEEVTYARLIRIDSDYYIQFGVGKITELDKKQEYSWGSSWPHTAIELKVPVDLFIKAIGTNHLSLTLGNYEKEMKIISKLLNLPIMRLDDENSIGNFLENY